MLAAYTADSGREVNPHPMDVGLGSEALKELVRRDVLSIALRVLSGFRTSLHSLALLEPHFEPRREPHDQRADSKNGLLLYICLKSRFIEFSSFSARSTQLDANESSKKLGDLWKFSIKKGVRA